MSENNDNDQLESIIFQLRTTLDHVGGYVFTKDIHGRYTYVNQMVCELFECPAEEILGKTDAALFDLDESSELIRNDERVLQHGERIEAEERNVFSHSHEERYYWSVKVPLYDRNGELTGMCGISTDITERRRLERNMGKQKALLDTVLNNADAAIFMKNTESRYLYANSVTAELFGLTPEELIGKRDPELMPAEEAAKFAAYDREVFASNDKIKREETFTGPDGKLHHYWTIKIPLTEQHRDKPAYIGIATDISDVVRLREKFKLLAHTDELTGIYNRRFLFENAERELKRAKRNQTQVSVIVIDIDRFKMVNDTFGHARGDDVLIKVVTACQSCVRETDLLGRIGGDEFVIVTPESNRENALQITQRLRRAVQALELDLPHEESFELTLSIGVAVSDNEEGFDQLLARADRALYSVKARDRDDVEVADD
jgi:diguanylate cyclase (GGDEF)-like protein/PAS domain S-box-containing protein